MKKGVSFEALSSLDAPVSFWKGIPFGLQHVMAMFVANLAPIFLVATAAKMDAAQSAAIIQAGLLVAGLGTCLQLYGVWLIGSRLPAQHVNREQFLMLPEGDVLPNDSWQYLHGLLHQP